MDIYYYLLLSIIQAATEFLPISSSGHLLFLKGLLNHEEIPILFDIIVHVGSLMAIVIYYFNRLRSTVNHARLELVDKENDEKQHLKWILFLLFSTAVTFVFYLLFKEFIERRYQTPSILVVTYVFSSVVLFSTIFTKKIQKKSSLIHKSILVPVLVGLFQGFAIFPGISRSGLTIAPMLLSGIEKEESAYYSFSLAIPAILGALLFKILEMESWHYLAAHWVILMISFLVSACFSYLFLRLLIFCIKKEKFWLFSTYTFVLAIVSYIIFIRNGI